MYKSESILGSDSDSSGAPCPHHSLFSRFSMQVLAMTLSDPSKRTTRRRKGKDCCPQRSPNAPRRLSTPFSSQVLDLSFLSLRFFRKQCLIGLLWPTGHSAIDSLVCHSDFEVYHSVPLLSHLAQMLTAKDLSHLVPLTKMPVVPHCTAKRKIFPTPSNRAELCQSVPVPNVDCYPFSVLAAVQSYIKLIHSA